jgi:hypothetical protein
MKKYTLLALSILTGAALALPVAAQARQQAVSASVTKHSVKKKSTAKKPARKTKKGVPLKTAKAVEAQTPVQTPTERLSDAELQTAQEIYTGTFPCELGERVSVTADESHPGFFTVTSDKRRYYMHPVESRTGAIRMEDNRNGAVWLQLGSKSMLMDQKAGQRVADNCEADAQKDYVAHMRDHPQTQLLDAAANSQQPPQAADHAAASVPANAENPSSAPATAAVTAGNTQNADSGQPPAAPAAALNDTQNQTAVGNQNSSVAPASNAPAPDQAASAP